MRCFKYYFIAGCIFEAGKMIRETFSRWVGSNENYFHTCSLVEHWVLIEQANCYGISVSFFCSSTT